jgi:hypothetical protein
MRMGAPSTGSEAVIAAFLVNSGESSLRRRSNQNAPPVHPTRLLGNPAAVESWLAEHRDEFARLAESRLQAGQPAG